MNFFGLNISVSKQPKALEIRSGGGSPMASVIDDMFENSTPLLGNAYEQVVWVYRAINLVAEQVANVPFRFAIGHRRGEEIITSGPLVDFYARPHPQMNRFQYWELRVIWLMLRGECFRIPIWDNSAVGTGRKLKHVLMLDPARFQHLVEDNRLVGWRYTGFGREAPLSSQVFLPEEVWHEKLPNPFDFWRGMPPLAVASTAANTDYAASMHMRGVMENNGEVGLILRTNEQLDPEQREQLVETLRARKRRSGTADKPVMLWAGAELITPKLSSGDLQFLENRRFSCSEICSAFGVPEELVTSTERAKYDVMAGARLNFIENRVVPLCRRLEAEEDQCVKGIDPKARGWFDVEDHPVLSQARRDRLAAARAGFEMGLPFNDLNEAFDLGFEPLPWGQKGYIAGKMQEVGERVLAARATG